MNFSCCNERLRQSWRRAIAHFQLSVMSWTTVTVYKIELLLSTHLLLVTKCLCIRSQMVLSLIMNLLCYRWTILKNDYHGFSKFKKGFKSSQLGTHWLFWLVCVHLGLNRLLLLNPFFVWITSIWNAIFVFHNYHGISLHPPLTVAAGAGALMIPLSKRRFLWTWCSLVLCTVLPISADFSMDHGPGSAMTWM